MALLVRTGLWPQDGQSGRTDWANSIDAENDSQGEATQVSAQQNSSRTGQDAMQGSQNRERRRRRRAKWDIRGIICHMGSSIWLKLTLFVGILVLVSCGILAFILWENCNTEIRNAIELRLRTIASLRAQQLLDYIEGRLDKGRIISSQVPLKGLLETQAVNGTLTASQRKIGRDDLTAGIQSLPEVLDLWAVDLKGNIVFAVNISTSLSDRNREHSVDVVQDHVEPILSPPYLDEQLGLIFNSMTPVMSNQRKVGILVSIINATKFQRLIYSQTGLSSTGEVIAGYVKEGDNGTVTYLVSTRLARNVSERYRGGPLQMATSKQTGFTQSRSYRDEKVAAAYTPVGYLNWGIVAQEESSEAYQPVKKLETIIVITIISVLLVGLVVSWLLARILTRPIVELSRIAEALAGGDMEARAMRGYRLWEDEIDGLRRTFNTMADQLASAYATLEAKVQERTQELACANEELEHEVAQRKKVEVDLEAARNVAVAADKMKSEWLANMSHEIRTPLNGVINCTELCMDTSTTPEQHEYLELSLFSAKHLLRLITDILDFSKIEAGKLNMESIEFGLHDQMERAISVLAAWAHKTGLDLVCRTASDIPEVLIGDPGRLFQIFINLVGNAIKFTDRGEVVLSASVCSQPDAASIELLFSVKDTGIGIPKDRQSRLFQAFSQVDASTTRIYGGTGLGLAISFKLANAMGGRMWVDSDEGHGSTFYFTASFLLPPSQPSPRGLLTPANLAPLKGLRTLVVGTSQTTRSTALDLLQRWGMSGDEAGSGGEALEKMETAAEQSKPFQLMLLDLDLPVEEPQKLSCPEILPLLRQQPHLLQRTRSNPSAVSKSKQALHEAASGNVAMPEVDMELELPQKFRDMRTIGKVDQAESDSGSGCFEACPQAGPASTPSCEDSSPNKFRPCRGKEGSDGENQPRIISEGRHPRSFSLKAGREDTGTSRGAESGHLEPGWSLPVLLMTSSANPTAAKVEELGVEAVVQRPIKRLSLLRAVRMALQLGDPSPQECPSSPMASLLPGGADPARKLHILVAEDNVINQRVALTLLRKWGHSTVLASTGAEAVEKYMQEGFDLVLMDVQMPVMDGLEATQKIREYEAKEGQRTPIVAMTAHAMMGDGQKCVAAGMDAYIPKPLNSSKLQELLRLVAERVEDLSSLPTIWSAV